MKRIVAYAIAIAMILALVPSTLATGLFTAEKAYEPNTNFQTNEGNPAADRMTSTSTLDKNVKEKYLTLPDPNSDLSTKTPWNEIDKSWLASFPDLGYGAVFEIPTDFADMDGFDEGDPNCWGLLLQWSADDETTYMYSEGEKVYTSVSLHEGFSAEDEVGLNIVVYGRAPEDEEGYIYLQGRASGTNSVGISLVAPTDGYQYIFLIFTDDQSYTSGKLFVTGSLYENDPSDLDTSATLAIGQSVDVEIGGSDSDLFLDNFCSLVYGKAFTMNLKEDDMFTLTFDGNDNAGMMAYIYNSDWGLVSYTGIPAYAFEQGYSYDNVYLDYRAPISQTIYVVISGYFFDDEGTVTVNPGPYSGSWTTTNNEINLSELGTENVHIADPNTGEIEEGYTWCYIWWAEDGVGELHLVGPGEYNFTGDNGNVILLPYDNTVIKLHDGAGIGGVFSIAQSGSFEIEAVDGESTIESTMIPYGITNADSDSMRAYAPLFITGKGKLNVSGDWGICISNAALYIGCAELYAVGTGASGSEIICGVIAIGETPISYGANVSFSDEMMPCLIWDSPSESGVLGYTVASIEAIHNYSDEWSFVANEVTIKTEVGLLGDANGDGEVNTGDAAAILRHMAQIEEINPAYMTNADYNLDGTVNTGDAAALLRHFAFDV